MSRTLRWLLPLVCIAAAVLVPFTTPGPVARFPVAVAPAVLLLAAAVAARRRGGSRVGRGWVTLGAGSLVLGYVLHHVLWFLAGAAQFPSPADALFLVGLASLCVGLHRATGPTDRTPGLDSLIIVAGPGVLVVSALVRPVVADLGTALAAVTVAYPVLDLALTAVAVRWCLVGHRPRWQGALLLTAAVVMVFGDTTLFLLVQASSGVLAPWYGTPWQVALTLMAVVAFAAGARPAAPRPGSERVRLILLPIASCVPPVALFGQGLAGVTVDWQVLGGGSVLMAVLVTIRLRGALRVLQAQAEALRAEARTDHLTGLPNRRAFTTDLADSLEDASAPAVAIALLDLDHFKRVNDDRGHAAGDRLLQETATAWTALLPSGVRLYRWGGEEFVLLLTAPAVREARGTVERLRTITPAPVTTSAGLAYARVGEGPEELCGRADSALYRSKQGGRDRLSVAEDRCAGHPGDVPSRSTPEVPILPG